MNEEMVFTQSSSPCVKCHLKLAIPSICNGCGTPQPVSKNETYFSVFGLHPQFGLEKQTLTQRFYFQSRKIHPDRYVNHAETQNRAWSVERMSFVNEALRVLSDRTRLREYMFDLFLKNEPKTQSKPPHFLAMEWFEVQEEGAENQSILLNFLEKIKKEIQVLGNLMTLEEKKFNDEFAKLHSETSSLRVQDELRQHPESLDIPNSLKDILRGLKKFQDQQNTLESLTRDVSKYLHGVK